MNKYKKALFLTFAFIVVIFGVNNYLSTKRVPDNRIAGVKTDGVDLSLVKIRGLIIPHHGLAKSLIDQSLNQLSQIRDYKFIVILGPNHYFLEGSTFTSTSSLTNTSIPSGTIENLKLTFPELILDETIMEKEHSITLPLTYIERYFPNAHIVPLAFSNVFDTSELEELASFLVNNLPEDTLFLASVDFTHETQVNEGLRKNEESIEAISRFDYSRVLEFEDDHLDSPTSIANLMMIMEKLEANNWLTWDNSHAAIIKDDQSVRGTGYVTGVFY